MNDIKQIFYVVLILLCFYITSCYNKNNTQITDDGKIEENKNLAITEEPQVDETDNFQGYYVYSSIDIKEYENIDLEKYNNLDETTYIRMKKVSPGKYNMETNFWIINYLLNYVREIEYPSEFFNRFNHNTELNDRFLQLAAEGFSGSIVMDLFYTGEGIVLDYFSEERYEEGDEKIECYIYFDKIE